MRNVFIVCLVNAPVLMKSDLYPTVCDSAQQTTSWSVQATQLNHC